MATPNKNVQTLDDFMHYGQTSSYSLPLSVLLRRTDGVIMIDKLAYDKYHTLLMNASVLIELTENEYNNYRYRPDKLAYDLYKHVNLSHLILYLNNIGEYDFNIRKVRILHPDYISDVFKKIMLRESSNIAKARKKTIE